MNATAQTFAIALGSVAAAAALGIGLADSTAAPETQLTRLERVVVVGQHAQPVTVAVVSRPQRAAIEPPPAEPPARRSATLARDSRRS